MRRSAGDARAFGGSQSLLLVAIAERGGAAWTIHARSPCDFFPGAGRRFTRAQLLVTGCGGYPVAQVNKDPARWRSAASSLALAFQVLHCGDRVCGAAALRDLMVERLRPLFFAEGKRRCSSMFQREMVLRK